MPAKRILLLRNGQSIEGVITQRNGCYEVDLGDGMLRVKAADVEMVCNNLDEGYLRKRALMQLGNVNQHLDLAHWCLRHDLLGRAAAELADAAAADPNHPMLAVLQQRLKMALEPLPPADPNDKPRIGPSSDELDRMVRGLPRGSVETFTQTVQPILVNNCAVSGCHGPQSDTALRLYRIPTGQAASRRVTQRNLYAVLPFVDRDNPAASQLLTVPNGPHGTARYAIFNSQQAVQLQRLIEWVGQLSGQPLPDAPPTITPAAPPRALSQEARKSSRPLSPADRNTARKAAKSGVKNASAALDRQSEPLRPIP